VRSAELKAEAEVDFISKAMEEIRNSDAEFLQREKDLIAALGPILGSHGMHELLKTIKKDHDGFLAIASSDFDSVLNPIPLKALAVCQYTQALMDRIEEYKKRFEGQ
jgi:hypothetical protein